MDRLFRVQRVEAPREVANRLGANGGPTKAGPSGWPLAQDAYVEQAHFKTKAQNNQNMAMFNRVYYDGHAGAIKYFTPY